MDEKPVAFDVFDEPCAECGEHELYVDPDSLLCDLCSVIKSALAADKPD